MDFPTAVKTGLSKYAVFDGRASRSEYWFFILFVVVSSLGTRILDSIISPSKVVPFLGGPLGVFLFISLLPAAFGVKVRRLHDTNHSGWHLLGVLSLTFIPAAIMIVSSRPPNTAAAADGDLVGYGVLIWLSYVVWFIFSLVRKGTNGSNPYGDDPLISPSEYVETIEFQPQARIKEVLVTLARSDSFIETPEFGNVEAAPAQAKPRPLLAGKEHVRFVKECAEVAQKEGQARAPRLVMTKRKWIAVTCGILVWWVVGAIDAHNHRNTHGFNDAAYDFFGGLLGYAPI